jgi:proteasome accessory factor B
MLPPESRYERLDAIERKFVQHPAGWTTGEMAREMDVSVDTIRRDMELLEARGTGFIKQGRRYTLDHRRSINLVKFTNDEILAIYLAARLLSRHSDEHNPHVVTALEKIADALRNRTPLMSRHIDQAANAVRGKRARKMYVEALEVLLQGWVEERKVWFRYRSNKDEWTERTFAPYFLEPSAIGYTCYAIGHDDLRDALRTFKVESIVEAKLTNEHYTIPDNFDPLKLLASAWGVIWRDKDDIEITVRFAPEVVPFIHNRTWHHTQRIEDLPDGSCLFTVRLGSTIEFKRWLVQWQPFVEVISPPELREEIIADIRAMAAVYKMEVES